MKAVLILHGYRGKPWLNWHPWLWYKLKKRGYKVWVPQLPDAAHPNAKLWTDKLLARADWKYNHGIVIGHSAGSVEIFNLLSNLPPKTMLDTAVLVSPFRPKPDWRDLARLLPKEPNYTLLRKRAKKIIIIHAVDDPVCPVEDAKYYAARLNAKLIILPTGGHFSVTRNVRFWRFPELLKILEKEKVI
jgi:uncharacterized protein